MHESKIPCRPGPSRDHRGPRPGLCGGYRRPSLRKSPGSSTCSDSAANSSALPGIRIHAVDPQHDHPFPAACVACCEARQQRRAPIPLRPTSAASVFKQPPRSSALFRGFSTLRPSIYGGGAMPKVRAPSAPCPQSPDLRRTSPGCRRSRRDQVRIDAVIPAPRLEVVREHRSRHLADRRVPRRPIPIRESDD